MFPKSMILQKDNGMQNPTKTSDHWQQDLIDRGPSIKGFGDVTPWM